MRKLARRTRSAHYSPTGRSLGHASQLRWGEAPDAGGIRCTIGLNPLPTIRFYPSLITLVCRSQKPRLLNNLGFYVVGVGNPRAVLVLLADRPPSCPSRSQTWFRARPYAAVAIAGLFWRVAVVCNTFDAGARKGRRLRRVSGSGPRATCGFSAGSGEGAAPA